MHKSVMGKACLNLMPHLMFLTCDFALRWPKGETGFDYINKQLIYNEITVVMTVQFPLFVTVRSTTGCSP
jgi:hypothetical protein